MLCKILSRCLTSRITGIDQPPLAIMQIFYAIINNVHVDYATLIWEGDDSNAIKFVDSVLLSQEDPNTKIYLRSDKERLEVMNIDYVATIEEEEESVKVALI
nr:hypothetical protein [Tanacetum cinerariifolium]